MVKNIMQFLSSAYMTHVTEYMCVCVSVCMCMCMKYDRLAIKIFMGSGVGHNRVLRGPPIDTSYGCGFDCAWPQLFFCGGRILVI